MCIVMANCFMSNVTKTICIKEITVADQQRILCAYFQENANNKNRLHVNYRTHKLIVLHSVS